MRPDRDEARRHSELREELSKTEQADEAEPTGRVEEEMGDLLFAIANLARKARIDLDAEIEFLTSDELWDLVDPSVRQYFATPDEFKGKPWGPAYATLARVVYKEAPESPSLMLVLKPRVAGIEPLDILNYKQSSSDFPQQSTSDQFYDEAQWESYRGLGYWIAEQLFGERTAISADKWLPRKMFE